MVEQGGSGLSGRRVFTASAVELKELRRWVRDVAVRCRVPHDEIDDLVLVASELAANAIEASDPGSRIVLEVRDDGGGTVLVVENAGRPFHVPSQADLPAPSSVRGRGLALTELLGHEVTSDHDKGRTRVTARRTDADVGRRGEGGR